MGNSSSHYLCSFKECHGNHVTFLIVLYFILWVHTLPVASGIWYKRILTLSNHLFQSVSLGISHKPK